MLGAAIGFLLWGYFSLAAKIQAKVDQEIALIGNRFDENEKAVLAELDASVDDIEDMLAVDVSLIDLYQNLNRIYFLNRHHRSTDAISEAVSALKYSNQVSGMTFEDGEQILESDEVLETINEELISQLAFALAGASDPVKQEYAFDLCCDEATKLPANQFTLVHLAEYAIRCGKLQLAKEYLKRAKAIATGENDDLGLANAYFVEASVHICESQVSRAVDSFLKANSLNMIDYNSQKISNRFAASRKNESELNRMKVFYPSYADDVESFAAKVLSIPTQAISPIDSSKTKSFSETTHREKAQKAK